jgi:hypothetical protein
MISLIGLIGIALTVIGILILVHFIVAAVGLGVVLLVLGLLVLLGGGTYGRGRWW